jgi:ubiquinone/menaquinone biosynthesis C-methylase UbiE
MKQNKCFICGGLNSFNPVIENQVLLREEKCGICGSSRRNSAVAYAILKTLKLEQLTLKDSIGYIEKAGIKIYEAASSGIIHETLKSVKSYTCSEYFDGVKAGDVIKEIRCENLEELTFAENSFDIVIDQDVLEHVNNYEKAFSEICRVLKPEGSHIFTIPFNEAKNTQLRVEKNGKEIMSPVFHGDSIRENGIIVTVDYGKDLLGKIDKVGFETEILAINKWHESYEITWIESDNEYKNYLKFKNNPLAYFKYNNEVFISKKMDSKKNEKNVKMKFTGERMMPEFNKGDEIHLEHMTRYIFASQFVKDKEILDIACGSGYGSDYILKSGAKKVTGVDISGEAIDYCKEKYIHKNLNFMQGDATKIPLDDHCVDIIISFETIEHIGEESQKKFMEEIKRVLRANGMLIMSTPNVMISPQGNPFHVKELTLNEFKSVLSKNFSKIKVFFQENIEGDFILSEDVLLNDDVSNSENVDFFGGKLGMVDPYKSTYFVAVCSNVSIESKGIISMSQNLSRDIHKNIIQQKNQEIKQKDWEIQNMKSSKFWKLQNKYMSVRGGALFVLSYSKKFIKKIF